MGVEIEHKFLVRRDRLPQSLPVGTRIQQGYLSVEPVVRVRISAERRRTRAYLTIKGSGLRKRLEFEYDIPVSDARQLLKLCGNRVLTKVRRRLGRWEVDEFLGRHRGLWLAEVELPSDRARLPRLPAWLGREVTTDGRYSNARLACKPISVAKTERR
jgi:adenylate cyclase